MWFVNFNLYLGSVAISFFFILEEAPKFVNSRRKMIVLPTRQQAEMEKHQIVDVYWIVSPW